MARSTRRTSLSGTGRLSLSGRFVLISLVGIVLVAVSVVVAAAQVMRQQSIDDGVRTAQTAAGWVSPLVPLHALESGVLADEDRAALDAATAGLADTMLGLRLWTVDGALIYDSESDSLAGFPSGTQLEQAVIAGEPSARIRYHLAGADEGQVGASSTAMDVYVPLRLGGTVAGALEVVLDHTTAAATQAQAVRTIALAAGLGLLVLWLVLYRTVHRASENLQRSAMDNARMALLDSLTGLPNRRMLLDRLRRAVVACEAGGPGVGILLLDVDRFKEINDTLGHDRGDDLLEQVAQRLQAAFRGRDLVARLGGDEFAVLLAVDNVDDAERLAHRARSVFVEPFALGDLTVHVATSIGVAMIPDHADDASGLMRKADIAMYTAKQHRLGVSVYDVAEDGSSPSRLVLQGELHEALATGELAVHYQPKIDLVTGRTAGLEALVRWRHPARGWVPPTVFIPLAEQSGLINDVTDVVLRSVVEQLARWAPADRVPIAVNLSAHTVVSPSIVDTVCSLLAEHDVDPEHLQVEITETALVADPTRVVPVLRALDESGVRVAIDDFGIGQTSIAQLRDLPVDVLKIDQLFVADLADPHDGERARSVIKAMVDLAHSFGLQVVAEGVEDGATAATLRSLDVDQAQGFWYSRAVPAEDVVISRGEVHA
ncbi:EAL domain-containing protein [Actinotalea sp. M2MS4P-6]|uniref:putative bifunctional diguanylate cyclase/phosphodiesterase n=1 Tax=Actinotalea sp. M2MS4P-6 TaxID=2983762 RepID=UPI0021E3E28F|nr:EAL domain-containing protein [Actinotalea sp. M2MS4P-6]MCV2394884.1 EAL domain-containing protein [Actinotalea sp. M2MS4P-6]